MFALLQPASSQPVNSPMLCGGHQPCGRVVRDALLRPLLERGEERVLREVFRQTGVTHDASQAGDYLGGFDPPYGVDRAMGI